MSCLRTALRMPLLRSLSKGLVPTRMLPEQRSQAQKRLTASPAEPAQSQAQKVLGQSQAVHHHQRVSAKERRAARRALWRRLANEKYLLGKHDEAV